MIKETFSLKVERSSDNLREMVVDKMRVAILIGHFKSSQRLIERSLCQELDVSRTIVREAVRYLEAEGLVEHIPNKGPIVSPLTLDIIEQVYAMRILIETRAGKQCASSATQDTKDKLKVALEDLKHAYGGDIIDLIAKINVFYQIIFESTKQDIAWNVVEHLNGRISRLRAMTLNTQDRHILGYQRMCEIYQGIYDNDPKSTVRAIGQHLKEASNIAKHLLRDLSDQQDSKKLCKGYWVASVTVTDPQKYSQYTALTPSILKKYGAKILVRGGRYQELQGQIYQKQVILEFESMQKALECYSSEAYQSAKKHRDDACVANIMIVEGEPI